MPDLLIPEIPSDLHQRLLASASRNKHSVTQEALELLDEALCRREWARELKLRKRRQPQKHIVEPASAEEIRRGLKVTRKDKAIVRKVLTELGYIGKKPKKPSKPKTHVEASTGRRG